MSEIYFIDGCTFISADLVEIADKIQLFLPYEASKNRT